MALSLSGIGVFVSDFEISAQNKELKKIIIGNNLEKFLDKKIQP